LTVALFLIVRGLVDDRFAMANEPASAAHIGTNGGNNNIGNGHEHGNGLVIVPPKTPGASSTPSILPTPSSAAAAAVAGGSSNHNRGAPLVGHAGAVTPAASSVPLVTPSSGANGMNGNKLASLNAALALVPNSPWATPGLGAVTPLASSRSLDEISAIHATERKEAFKEKALADEATFSAFFKQSHKLRKYGRGNQLGHSLSLSFHITLTIRVCCVGMDMTRW
jgi:hypothetical protein